MSKIKMQITKASAAFAIVAVVLVFIDYFFYWQDLSRRFNFFYLIFILLLLVSFVVIYKNAQARNKAEAEIRKLNATLEKKVEEKALKISERETQYRFLIENMQEGIQVIGFDWRYLFVNRSLLKQSKYSKEEELLGHTMMEKYPGIENTEMFKVLRQSMIERTSHLLENEFIHPDGTKEYFELSIQPVPEGLFVLSMDISERKKVEGQKHLLLNALQKSVNEIYLFRTDTLLFEYVNQGALKNLGYTEKEMYQLTPYQIKPDYTLSSFRDMIKPLLNHEIEKKVFETYHQRKDGSLYPVEVHLQLISQENQDIFLSVILDITERKQSEWIKKQLDEKLQKRAVELQASNAELERFAYIASHDLQEPLRMVSSFLQLLEKKLDGNLDEAGRQYIGFAVDGADRMKKLIHDLLEYSRLGSNNENIEKVDCNEIMNTVNAFYGLKIRETNSILQVNELPVIRGVHPQILQVFQNLVGNALKYHGNKSPEIEVGCSEQENYWQFYVKDNGIGIDPKFFDKIFIIFQRLHNKTDYSGTGIGLSVCKKIVKRHGGRIWVESEAGNGSTFYFTISKK